MKCRQQGEAYAITGEHYIGKLPRKNVLGRGLDAVSIQAFICAEGTGPCDERLGVYQWERRALTFAILATDATSAIIHSCGVLRIGVLERLQANT